VNSLSDTPFRITAFPSSQPKEQKGAMSEVRSKKYKKYRMHMNRIDRIQ